MSAKRSKALRAGIEGLERRDNPSGAVAAVAVHHADAPSHHADTAAHHAAATSDHAAAAAANASSIAIRNRGHAAVLFSQPVVNGQEVLTVLDGTSKELGTYSGILDITYGRDPRKGTGIGVITAADGDEVELDLQSTITVPSRPHGNGGKIYFKIISGSGQFAGVTGRGTISGNVNTSYAYPYALQGHITLPSS
jgi:hypothetical protein